MCCAFSDDHRLGAPLCAFVRLSIDERQEIVTCGFGLRRRRLSAMRALLRLPGGLALLAALAVSTSSSARGGADKPDPRKLVESYFTASVQDRSRILGSLAEFDGIASGDVEGWKKTLLGLASRGRRATGKAKATLYDVPARGVYLLGGRKGADSLLVALHGGGVGAGDAGQAASAFGGAASSLGMRLVAPEVLEKTERGWTDPVETELFVLDLIDALVRTEKLDPNRVFLTGHSMGGYGTWTIGAVHADRFAGLAVFAGAPTCLRVRDGAPISSVIDGVLPNLRNLPIFVYQSGDDQNVPPESNDFAMPELDRLASADPTGYVHTYERVEGRAHGFPQKGPEPGIAWASKRPRDPRPKKVVWQPSRGWKTQFYWLRWLRPALGTVVTVEATGSNRFEVSASGPTDGLEILLDAKSADLAKEVVVTSGAKEVFRGLAKPSLVTMVRSAERGDPDLLFTASVPAGPR